MTNGDVCGICGAWFETDDPVVSAGRDLIHARCVGRSRPSPTGDPVDADVDPDVSSAS